MARGIGFIEQLNQGSLWLVSPDHKLHILVPASQGPVVLSADGRQFAWMAGKKFVGQCPATAARSPTLRGSER